MTIAALHRFFAWLHMIAPSTWLGGRAVLMRVLAPVLGGATAAQKAAQLVHPTGIGFRGVGCICLEVPVAAGMFDLSTWGTGGPVLTTGYFLRASSGHTLAAKLALVMAVRGASAVRDFAIGPHPTARLLDTPDSRAAKRARRLGGRMGRIGYSLALAIVGLAVMLVRSRP